ncbi:hypothetical protein [Microbacterium sp. cx-59]|uniref:hypothetical protein n=1 Tax=Microbacterium sp. cx-59 TaxID=2891207 RepID=UPI001E5EB23B|nr:hypothetical protein [Microbacterium sp. cx-59]MCC4907748.1 hypothetical protein [Microbacterium sp. cx-59]
MRIKRDIGRLIAHGLASKLTFDQACMRAGLFNEVYLHGTINEIVVSNISTADFWVRPGYAHPQLQDVRGVGKKAGRPRELDFFITPTAGRTGRSLAMEVKWTPSKHCSWGNVVSDLYRLKLVAMSEPTTDCMFVLCGPRTGVTKLLEKVQAENQKRAIGRMYEPGLVLRSAGSMSGSGGIAPVDENGRFLGGDSARGRLPLGNNGRRRIPTGITFQLAGEATVGAKEWTAAAWRVS